MFRLCGIKLIDATEALREKENVTSYISDIVWTCRNIGYFENVFVLFFFHGGFIWERRHQVVVHGEREKVRKYGKDYVPCGQKSL